MLPGSERHPGMHDDPPAVRVARAVPRRHDDERAAGEHGLEVLAPIDLPELLVELAPADAGRRDRQIGEAVERGADGEPGARGLVGGKVAADRFVRPPPRAARELVDRGDDPLRAGVDQRGADALGGGRGHA